MQAVFFLGFLCKRRSKEKIKKKTSIRKNRNPSRARAPLRLKSKIRTKKNCFLILLFSGFSKLTTNSEFKQATNQGLPEMSATDPILPSDDDETRRKKLKPKCNIDDVANLLSSSSLSLLQTASIEKELESYDDQNYLIRSTDTNKRYVLKIHNGVESDDDSLLEFQNGIMAHLTKHGITTTNPIEQTKNKFVRNETLPVACGKYTLAIRVLEYVEGVPMAYSNLTANTMLESGKFLGRVVTTLNSYQHESAKREHAWDSRQTSKLRPYIKYIQTEARQKLITSVIERFENEVAVDSANFPWGVLQADFNDANIIMDTKGGIAGVIDFGDSVYR